MDEGKLRWKRLDRVTVRLGQGEKDHTFLVLAVDVQRPRLKQRRHTEALPTSRQKPGLPAVIWMESAWTWRTAL